jgi:ribosomal-protein-alanine N-acetyltransferase
MFGPELIGDKARLAPIEEWMAETFFSWINAPDINRYRPAPPVESIEAEREWIRRTSTSESDIVWAVFCREDNELIGSMGLHSYRPQFQRAMSGTLIGRKEYWGRGIGSEIVRLRTQYAFDELRLHKLTSEVISENNPSLRMLLRVGYHVIGLRRDHFLIDGRWVNEYLLECMREDWEKAKILNGW